MNKPNRFENMKLGELYDMVPKVSYGKEARELHRALKKYGDGLPLYGRYPMFPLYISIVALVSCIVAVIMLVI